jgi:hypothetical protein
MLLRPNMTRSDSDSTESEGDASRQRADQVDHNYISVMSRRKSELDNRLLRHCVEMNLLEKQSELPWTLP